MSVQRFDPAWRDGFMQEEGYGDYVRYSDYENLEDDFKILQRDYAEIVMKLNDIVALA